MDGTPPPTPVAAVIEPMEISMKTSTAGQTFIHGFEAFRAKAYKDVKGIPTIGWGHSSAAGPPHVAMGMVITLAEGNAIFARDITKFERAVLDLCKGIVLAQHEFDALVSLIYNIGEGAFEGSSVLRHLKAGKRQAAADAMRAWNKSGRPKRVIAGLVRRRAAERKLLLTGDYGAPTPEEHKPMRSGPTA